MFVVAEYLQFLFILFMTVKLLTLRRLYKEVNNFWVDIFILCQLLRSRQYIVIDRNSLLNMVAHCVTVRDVCTLN